MTQPLGYLVFQISVKSLVCKRDGYLLSTEEREVYLDFSSAYYDLVQIGVEIFFQITFWKLSLGGRKFRCLNRVACEHSVNPRVTTRYSRLVFLPPRLPVISTLETKVCFERETHAAD